jgi:hypothetical protein
MLLFLIWTHFIADFIFQSDQMAINKSKSIKYLSLHVFIYSVCFLYIGWKFALINFLAHWIIDFITSKINSKLYTNHRHWFFTMIGFDQALHTTTLVLTYCWMIK